MATKKDVVAAKALHDQVHSRPVVRRPWERHAVKLVNVDADGVVIPSKTHQSFKETACINRIMSSYEKDGIIPPNPLKTPRYGDVSALNAPYDQLLMRSRQTLSDLTKYTDDQREKIRLAKIAQRKKDAEDAAAYRAHLAAVGKNNTTDSQSA